MRNVKKPLFAALAVILLVGVTTPALADIDGEWEGKGTGCVLSPGNGKLVYIYAFQVWNCSVYSGSLSGEWEDETGNYGYFEGYETESPGGPGFVTYEGSWFWISGGWSIEMGDFSIDFKEESETCSGEWWYDFRPMANPGTIDGEKVD